MARDRFELNRAGLGEFLTSAPVAAALSSKADRVVAAGGGKLVAESGVSPGGGPVPARARVRVGYPASVPAPKALRDEAKRGTLARALAAGGG